MKNSIYLYYGTEDYLIEEEINRLVNTIIPPEEQELNKITYDLNDVPIEDVIADAETSPFFSEHKVILAKNAYMFTGQKAPKGIEHDLESLEGILDNPVDFSTIIFWVSFEKLDERKRIVKKIKKNGQVKSFVQLSGTSLIEWLKARVRAEGANITDDAAQLLIHTTGQNLQLLSQEIKKMSVYVGENQMIDQQVIQELSTRTMEQNIFSLIDKVANFKIEEALQIFYDLLKNKEEPVKMIALFARQFRIMLYTKELNRIGYSAKQIASQIGAHPYTVQIALTQSKKFSEVQLKSIIKKLAEIDLNIKTGKMDKILSLEMFMFYLKGLMAN